MAISLSYTTPPVSSLMVRKWSTVPISLSYTTPPVSPHARTHARTYRYTVVHHYRYTRVHHFRYEHVDDSTPFAPR
jgi:hypothetical protein